MQELSPFIMFFGFDALILGLDALAAGSDPEHSSAQPMSAAPMARRSLAGRQAVNLRSRTLWLSSTISPVRA